MSNYSLGTWRIGLLGEILTVQNGYAFKSETFLEKNTGAVPIIRMSNLKSGICDLAEAVYVDKERVKPPKQFILQEGDFVFGMSGSLSNYATIRKQNLPCYLNQRVGKLCPKDSHKSFLNYLFLSETVQRQILTTAAGGAQLNISARQIEDIEVLIPPLKEQQKIAEILTSVDEVIENTQSQINKLEDLKRATMNELLTKGIGHTEFKETEIGRVPKSWTISTLGEVISKVFDFRGKTPRKIGMTWGGGNIRALSANNVRNGHIDFSAECYFASDQLYEKWMVNGDLRKDDLLFTMEAPLGNVSLVPDNQKYVLSQRVIALRLHDLVEPHFLFYYLSSSVFQRELKRNATGTTATGIQQKKLLLMYVPIPATDEQREISSVFKDLDSRILLHKRKLSSMEFMNNSLMQDLLTGKVRVTVN